MADDQVKEVGILPSVRATRGGVKPGKGFRPAAITNLSRRQFLERCGALPAAVSCSLLLREPATAAAVFHSPPPQRVAFREVFYRPHYLSESPTDSILEKVDPSKDDAFPTEAMARAVYHVLGRWTKCLLDGGSGINAIAASLNAGFTGRSLEATEKPVARSDDNLQISHLSYQSEQVLNSVGFLSQLRTYLGGIKFLVVEFKITQISLSADNLIQTRLRYDLVDTSAEHHRRQRSGVWDLEWRHRSGGDPEVIRWRPLTETCSRALRPIFQEITAEGMGDIDSYHRQLVPGTDYWRTLLDGACGIDVYGNYGVAVGDIDNDGFDDLYICQPSGLPNRLYRNRGDGTFEDVTYKGGVGVLDSSPCALFADVNNDGYQDLIVVRGTGPLLFTNRGNGRFGLKADAFRFAQPAQGTFTGAALADYDRDGWLDIYFCLYSYYQGPDRYRYPMPYYDAQNGPPNFLFRNGRDETFVDVTQAAGLNQNNNRFSFACGWGDYNNDGWPDLYVANDFGRKNLYRNNRDGTFTDVARQAGVLDTGAGMSVCWLDFDNDGRQDIYVADMWTAAGLRITCLDEFMHGVPNAVRDLYKKHAMGNSLFRNGGNANFTDATSTSGTGFGRWAWSSDSWDFDNDGYPDLYIANGMISGPDPEDLSSFFWRQVVARSPLNSVPASSYEQGWNAINELIRSDGTWNGYERNVFYANNRDGTFSDVSGAVGLDFVDDSRSFALADIDHDGRLELILKNRTGPQLRILRNVAPNLGESIAFRLHASKSNRDAIGARIMVKTGSGQQVKSVQAGSGFLAQHTKDVFFGLGRSGEPLHATVNWPSGLVQVFESLPPGHLIEIEEGSAEFNAVAFGPKPRPRTEKPAAQARVTPLSGLSETWLIEPLDAPDFALPDLAGRIHKLSSYRGVPVLIYFWSAAAPGCAGELRALEQGSRRLSSADIRLLAVNLDPPEKVTDARMLAARLGLTFPLLPATADVGAIYNLLYRYLFDRRRNLPLPISFLLDRDGMIVKLYRGPLKPANVASDVEQIPRTARERPAKALPFPGTFYGGTFSRNYFTYGVTFARHGYFSAAEAAFLRAMRQEPGSPDAYYDLGTLYMRQRKWELASDQLRKALELKPDDLMGLNNLGVIAARLGRAADAESYFTKALQIDPQSVLALENLADLYRTQGRYTEAEALVRRALQLEPDNPDLAYRLGMAFADARQNEQAEYYLKEAIRLRPDYPEALNNLGILYVMLGHLSLALSQFETCIERAPKFDEAYLNLARVDARLGRIEDARTALRGLLREFPDHPLAKKFLQELGQ